MKKKEAKISRVKLDGSKFSLGDLSTNRLTSLGSQTKDRSITHTAFIRKHPVGDQCYTDGGAKLNGYCSYSFLYCENVGLLGVLFYSFKDRTRLNFPAMLVSRNVQEDVGTTENFTPLFTFERLDLLVYSSPSSSLVIIPTVLPESPLLVQAT